MKLQLRYLRSEVDGVNEDEVINEIIVKPASTLVMHKWGQVIWFQKKIPQYFNLSWTPALSPTFGISCFFDNYAFSENVLLYKNIMIYSIELKMEHES